MHVFVRLLAAGLCAAAACAVQAQSTFGAPNPAGLRPVFPAGITSGSGAAQSGDPVARATAPISAGPGSLTLPSAVAGGTRAPGVFDAGFAAPNTAVLGAGPVAGPSQLQNSGAGGFSAADSARSFFVADANHDGELSRAEARRLSIATQSFEEMDRNFDGVITRFEYDDSLR